MSDLDEKLKVWHQIEFDASSQFAPEVLEKIYELADGSTIKLVLALGDIVNADSDAIVVPSNPGFKYEGSYGMMVQEAVAQAFGNKPFEEASAKAQDMLNESYLVGEGRDSNDVIGKQGLPFGMSLVTDIHQPSRIKKIIHVNSLGIVTADLDFRSETEPISYVAKGALKTAIQEGIGSVAFPVIGNNPLGGIGLGAAMKAIWKGIYQYLNIVSSSQNLATTKIMMVVFYGASKGNIEFLEGFLNKDE